MAYYNDYLKVLPSVDVEEIRKVIQENQDIMTIKNLTEEEFKQLLDVVAVEETPVTQPVELTEKIEAQHFNDFYANVQIDLAHLFMEQNQLEGLAENYNRIFDGNIEDIKNHVEKLKQKVIELDMEKEGEAGLTVFSYNFDPNQESQFLEKDPSAVSQNLWLDRDGTVLQPITVSRKFHHYFGSLGRTKKVNALEDDAGNRTASVKLLYQSPYTISATSDGYGIENIIDGNEQTFWYSVALKPDNSIDEISINPEEM